MPKYQTSSYMYSTMVAYIIQEYIMSILQFWWVVYYYFIVFILLWLYNNLLAWYHFSIYGSEYKFEISCVIGYLEVVTSQIATVTTPNWIQQFKRMLLIKQSLIFQRNRTDASGV